VDPDTIRDVTRGRPVVLLAATEGEATPVLAALVEPTRHVVATKAVYVGEVGVPAGARGAASAAALGAVPSVPVVLVITGCDKANAAHALTCVLEATGPAPRLVLQFGIAGAFAPAGGPTLAVGGPAAAVGDIVLATSETYSDTGSSSPGGWLSAADLGLPIASIDGIETGGEFVLDAALVRAAAAVIEELDWPDDWWPDYWPGGGSDDPPTEESGSDGTPAGASDLGGRPAVLQGPCVTASRVTGLRSEAEATRARWGALAESMEGAAAAHICALYGVPFLEVRGVSNLVVDRDRDSWQVERAVAAAGRAVLAVVAALDRLPLGRR
jgi:futalosine hydrolase